MKNLIPALIKFQKEVPSIPKNCTNPFFSQGGKKAMYADLSTVIDTCLPVLNKSELCLIQRVGVFESRNILTTMLYHSSGEFIDATIFLPDIQDPQKLTAAITYLRRSSYLAILGLVADDDNDGNNLPGTQSEKVYSGSNNSNHKNKNKQQTNYPASDAQKGAMRKLGIQFNENVTKQEAMKLLGDFNKGR